MSIKALLTPCIFFVRLSRTAKLLQSWPSNSTSSMNPPPQPFCVDAEVERAMSDDVPDLDIEDGSDGDQDDDESEEDEEE